MAPPRIDDAERRRRLLRRHHLAPGSAATSIEQAAGSLVGLHASDPTTVFLAALARMPGLTVADVESALYDQRAVLRILGMRRTLFVVPRDLAPIIQAACAEPIARTERRRLLGILEAADPDRDAVAWLAKVEADVEAALDRRGSAAAVELTKDVPALAEQFAFGAGTKWAGTFGLSTRVLFLMAAEWRIVRGRPRGSWVSGQYRWAHLSHWVPDLPPPPDPAEGRRLLVERWLRAFGPGTERDLAWWSGLTLGHLRSALAELPVITVSLDDGEGLVMADDLEPTEPSSPRAILLPGLDPTPMGWKERGWFIGDHAKALFDTNGNIGPTVWWNGRAVGAWAQTADGTVVHRLLEDIGRQGERAVVAAAAELTDWFGGTRVMPRFPAPIHRDLAG